MSTIRATFVQHGSSPVPNITLNASGQVIVASGIVSSGTFAAPSGSVSAPGLYFVGDSNTGIYSPSADTIAFTEGGVESVRIDSSGRVGIGTTSPIYLFDVQATSGNGIRYKATSTGFGLYIGDNSGTPFLSTDTASPLTFGVQNSERARIDTSGRLLVGTSSARSIAAITSQSQIEGTTFDSSSFSLTLNSNDAQSPYLEFAKTRGTSNGSNTVVQNGDQLGYIGFAGADGSDLGQNAAAIAAYVDGTPGANDMPGRLVFSTTADGASSPTERMRISNNGTFSAVIPDGSTLFPAFYCRAWVNFNGTGTVAIRGSGNVSSITDHDIGRYTVNLTTAMPDTNYGYSVSAGNGATNLQVRPYGPAATPTTSSFRVETQSGTGTDDLAYVAVTLFR